MLLSGPTWAAALVLLLGVLAELFPPLSPIRILSQPAAEGTEAEALDPSALSVGEAELPSETVGRADLAPGAQTQARARGPIATAEPALDPSELLDKEPPVAIEDTDGRSLDGFFHALVKTHEKRDGAITRIVHFGDSIVVSDYVSGMLRRRFQERFGDAGHGFTLIANAWPAYFQNDVERYATRGWKVSRIVGPLASDGWYGLGCVSFRAQKNTLARFGTAQTGDFGRSVSRFVVSYVSQPGGGTFRLSVDGELRARVDSQAEVKRAETRTLQVPDGPHELEIMTESGVSRLFGVILERDVPGVVLDSIGIQGARIRFLDKQDDAHWAEQLKLRHPDLLIYEFGANESADGLLYPMDQYNQSMRAVLAQGRKALPESSCLVIGAMDRAKKKGEHLESLGIIPLLVAEQRAVARAVGCAFFDTYRAMGGRGSMPTWVRRGLGQADMTHPSAVGSNMLGTWVYRALMKRYGEYLSARSRPAARKSD